MDILSNKVAVITGAASGIGRGLASVFAREGMKLVLADIEPAPLLALADDLSRQGVEALPMTTDVADRGAMFALAEAAYGHFGQVHVLCNNAGVGGATGALMGIWNAPPESWQWVLGVNLMGVVHGLQAFVPRMLAAGEDGHIVNTSSVMGVWAGPGAIYNVSKHAVTALSEGLYYDLRAEGAKLGVTVLLPGLTATRINTAARNRPENLVTPDSELSSELQQQMETLDAFYLAKGMSPERVGEIVVDAIRRNRFYAFTHAGSENRVEARMKAIVAGEAPPKLRERG